MGWIRRHLSYANVVASIALFLALGGGAYAVAGNQFVGRNGAVKMCVRSTDHVPQLIRPGSACPAGSSPLTLRQKGQRGKRGPRGPAGAATAPSYIDAYTAQNSNICGGCHFVFVSSTGQAGIQAVSSDIRLGDDNATFTLTTSGTYLVTAAVGPAGPVQLEVNGTRVGPNETSCSGTGVCTFQRILSLMGTNTITLVNTTTNPEPEDPGSGITILRIA